MGGRIRALNAASLGSGTRPAPSSGYIRSAIPAQAVWDIIHHHPSFQPAFKLWASTPRPTAQVHTSHTRASSHPLTPVIGCGGRDSHASGIFVSLVWLSPRLRPTLLGCHVATWGATVTTPHVARLFTRLFWWCNIQLLSTSIDASDTWHSEGCHGKLYLTIIVVPPSLRWPLLHRGGLGLMD